MPCLWPLLWSLLPPLVLSSCPGVSTLSETQTSRDASSALESLSCHNNYESYIDCEWTEGPHTHTSLQLWFQTGNNRKNLFENTGQDGTHRKRCMPFSSGVHEAGEPRTVRCRYWTTVFSIGVKHTVFFLDGETLQPAAQPKTLHLSQLLRTRPPVGLSTNGTGDGGRLLRWSDPYKDSPAPGGTLIYQVNYKMETEDSWTILNVAGPEVELMKQHLRPSSRYEARVRARAAAAHWSLWSPVVTWWTEEDTGRIPSVHCVLEGEMEVMCSWEVSRELHHLITYQLACRHNQTAMLEKCCLKPTVVPDPGGKVLKYSCSLTLASPGHLLLELQPKHNTRTFWASKHIHPEPPGPVRVTAKGKKWLLEWAEPRTAARVPLDYQVCYYSTQDQGCSSLLNISGDNRMLFIPDNSLTPSQRHQVKVRALVNSGQGSLYKGTPSDWTEPVGWTSHPATWSFSTLIHVFIGLGVVTVFLTLYLTISACQRRINLWGDSIPSPNKSKIFSENKKEKLSLPMQLEHTSICSLDNGFSRQFSQPNWTSADDDRERNRETEESMSFDSARSSAGLSLYAEDSVILPHQSTFQNQLSDADTTAWSQGDPEQGLLFPDYTLMPNKLVLQPVLGWPASTYPPQADVPSPLSPRPGVVTSGYCFFPAEFTAGSK